MMTHEETDWREQADDLLKAANLCSTCSRDKQGAFIAAMNGEQRSAPLRSVGAVREWLKAGRPWQGTGRKGVFADLMP